jgi:hypothetical protein
MRKVRNLTLSAALFVLAAGVPFAGTATAQPNPPPPPGLPAPFMPGDLHVRIVTNAPPMRQHEVRTERPDRNHVWQAGYWHHTGMDWNWNDGRWSEPRPNAHWVNASYKKVKGGTRYTPAHWSNEKLIYD